jgi:hypothetical protein
MSIPRGATASRGFAVLDITRPEAVHHYILVFPATAAGRRAAHQAVGRWWANAELAEFDSKAATRACGAVNKAAGAV